MKIKKIEDNINFGFNKTLNKEFISRLRISSENAEFMKELQRLNDYANNLEKRIRNIDDKGVEPITLANLSRIFTTLKSELCKLVNDVFPELNYASRECSLYKAEIEKRELQNCSEHWLNRIIKKIESLANTDAVESETKEEDAIDKQLHGLINEYNSRSFETVTPDIKALKKMEGAKYVEEYVPTESANRGFAGLGGMQELKELLNDRIVSFLKNPEQAKLDEIEYGKKIPKGILMYGPQGCGKTTIAEHLSVEAGVPLLKINSEKTGSKYIHETSERIASVFDYAEAFAKTIGKPVLVMIDDADGLLASRQNGIQRHHTEEMATFLNRIQRAGENNVVVISATNKYDLMDDAIKSRFEEQIYVGLPDLDARKSIVKMFMNERTKGRALANNEDAINDIAQKLDSFSIRDIKMISEKASLEAMKDGRRNIETQDYEKIIAQNQKRKIKEDKFKPNSERKLIGFI